MKNLNETQKISFVNEFKKSGYDITFRTEGKDVVVEVEVEELTEGTHLRGEFTLSGQLNGMFKGVWGGELMFEDEEESYSDYDKESVFVFSYRDVTSLVVMLKSELDYMTSDFEEYVESL